MEGSTVTFFTIIITKEGQGFNLPAMLEQNLKLKTYYENKPVWVASLTPRSPQDHRGFLTSRQAFQFASGPMNSSLAVLLFKFVVQF